MCVATEQQKVLFPQQQVNDQEDTQPYVIQVNLIMT